MKHKVLLYQSEAALKTPNMLAESVSLHISAKKRQFLKHSPPTGSYIFITIHCVKP